MDKTQEEQMNADLIENQDMRNTIKKALNYSGTVNDVVMDEQFKNGWLKGYFRALNYAIKKLDNVGKNENSQKDRV